MGTEAQRPEYHCSFCDASQNDRKQLVMREIKDGHVAICEECVVLCFETIIKRTPKIVHVMADGLLRRSSL